MVLRVSYLMLVTELVTNINGGNTMGFLTKRNHNPFDKEFGEVDNFFSEFFKDPWEMSIMRPTWPTSRFTNIARHPVRTQKNENGSLKFEFDVPGVDKNDIDIHYDVETNILSVSSKCEEKSDNSNATSSRSFYYQVIARNLESETIEATCDKGILTISGEPIEKQRSRKRIKIK